MTLSNTFIHNREINTERFFEYATCFHKSQGTSSVMLQITRKQFFDTLTNEIQVLSSLNVPTLIVWGRQEKSISLSIGRKLHELLPRSRFEVLDEAGHCSNIDQLGRFNQLVLGFLAFDRNAS
jgi:pimeloyl-ACP methyl ester carboxylesterase